MAPHSRHTSSRARTLIVISGPGSAARFLFGEGAALGVLTAADAMGLITRRLQDPKPRRASNGV